MARIFVLSARDLADLDDHAMLERLSVAGKIDVRYLLDAAAAELSYNTVFGRK